jgi:hypothetical protein
MKLVAGHDKKLNILKQSQEPKKVLNEKVEYLIQKVVSHFWNFTIYIHFPSF